MRALALRCKSVGLFDLTKGYARDETTTTCFTVENLCLEANAKSVPETKEILSYSIAPRAVL